MKKSAEICLNFCKFADCKFYVITIHHPKQSK